MLTSAGFIVTTRYFQSLATLYSLTAKYQPALGVYTIALAQVSHDIAVTDIFVHCLQSEKYELVSAREFRARYAPGETRGVRFPDLILVRNSDKRELIVEYENSDKNLARTRAILDYYFAKSATLIVLCASQFIFNNYSKCSQKLCAEKSLSLIHI